MLDNYFHQLDEKFNNIHYTGDSLGASIFANIENNNFPSFEGAVIALVGVPEYRGAVSNNKAPEGIDYIREKFYKLKVHLNSRTIIDLGNLILGETLNDTYAAVATVVSELLSNNVIPVIIGGSQDLTYAHYSGYKKLEQIVNLVCVDSRFDLGSPDDGCNSETYLGNIIMEQPNYLFNFSNIGYQTYFVGSPSIEIMNKLFFETYRLGHLRTNIEEAEPIVRNADFLSVDISSIRNSDAPGNKNATPNGFYGEEICQIMMYAGLSDKSTGVGFYEYNADLDINNQTAHLIAQMIWFYVEGVGNRKNETPALSSANYLTYRVPISEIENDIVFIKSLKSNRWWMKMPVELSKNRYMSQHLMPCSYKDYQQACTNEVPDRWWSAFHKLS
ncbi:MAG: formimidoylglutamase [Bacteroidota bacterium]